MPSGDRHSVSRRHLIAASLGLPAASIMPTGGVGLHQGGVLPDPLVERVAAWITERQRLDALTFAWQRLETQLMSRAKTLGVDMDVARGRRLPEARAMRALDAKMETYHRKLADLAEAASIMRAVSAEGALAKVQLGLHVQGRYGWQDHALELLQGGADELGLFLERAGRRASPSARALGALRPKPRPVAGSSPFG